MRAAQFNPIPARDAMSLLAVSVVRAAPAGAQAIGVAVSSGGEVPACIGLDRAELSVLGFDGEVGQTLYLTRHQSATLIAVGTGAAGKVDARRLRHAAGAFGRATSRYARVALDLAGIRQVPAEAAGQAVVEGVILARYRYTQLRYDPAPTILAELALVTGAARRAGVETGAARGRIAADATCVARDLANTPPAYLTARAFADVAQALAEEGGLEVEVFDTAALMQLGCGGMLGVNAGSADPPRLVKLAYRPVEGPDPPPHLGIVGEGVMNGNGRTGLWPSDAFSPRSRLDMAGAGATLAAMTALRALRCPTRVTAWLACTDHVTSGSATRPGDVLTVYGGRTVEVQDTAAEMRVAVVDALGLAAEERVDAIIDIGTLTPASAVVLGTSSAGLFGNNQALVDEVRKAAETTDETVWQLPLDRRLRPRLDSDIADLRVGGEVVGGAITAALFLAEFVGDVPWAHLDIAGTAYCGEASSWKTRGGTGFGTRLLIDLAMRFRAPTA